MWVRTAGIIAALSVTALALASALTSTHHHSQMQPANLTWDEPNFSVYRVVADEGAERPARKIAPSRDRSKVEAAIAELIRKRAEERRRERRQATETTTS